MINHPRFYLLLALLLSVRPAGSWAQTPAPAGATAAVKEGALRWDLQVEELDLETDSVQILNDRADLRFNHQSYDLAVREYGPASLYAHSARQGMRNNIASLQDDIRDHREDVKSAREEKIRLLDIDEKELALLRKNLAQDTVSMALDKDKVKRDRENLDSARRSSLEAVKRFGKGSPRARSAQGHVDYCLVALHEELGDLLLDTKKSLQDERSDRKALTTAKDDRAEGQ